MSLTFGVWCGASMSVAYKGMLADKATGKVATGKVFVGASFPHFPSPSREPLPDLAPLSLGENEKRDCWRERPKPSSS